VPKSRVLELKSCNQFKCSGVELVTASGWVHYFSVGNSPHEFQKPSDTCLSRVFWSEVRNPYSNTACGCLHDFSFVSLHVRRMPLDLTIVAAHLAALLEWKDLIFGSQSVVLSILHPI